MSILYKYKRSRAFSFIKKQAPELLDLLCLEYWFEIKNFQLIFVKSTKILTNFEKSNNSNPKNSNFNWCIKRKLNI